MTVRDKFSDAVVSMHLKFGSSRKWSLSRQRRVLIS